MLIHTDVNSVPVSQFSGNSSFSRTRNCPLVSQFLTHAPEISRHSLTNRVPTYTRHNLPKPRILFYKLLEPLPGRRPPVFDSPIHPCPLEMDACFRHFLADAFELTPSGLLEALKVAAGLANGEVVRTGPRRGVFDVIVARHVLCYYGDGEGGMAREGQGGREAYHSCAGVELVFDMRMHL